MSFAFPFSQPSDEDGNYTVNQLISEPTRITAAISDLAADEFFLDKVYSTIGGVTGGAVLYDQVTSSDLDANGAAGIVSAGGEFPFVGQPESKAKVAPVRKIGGKFFVTDEAVKRNSSVQLSQGVQRLSNTVRRGMTDMGISLIKDTFESIDGAREVTSVGWSGAAGRGANARKANTEPLTDFVRVDELGSRDDFGYSYSTWLINPSDYANFRINYGTESDDVLNAFGVTLVPTRNVPAGTAYAVDEGNVGIMGVESPLSTETWREPGVQSTFIQSWVSPVFAVTNPYAIVKVTGVGA